ncbi:hypothetical protein H6776_00875 [Candidatus Nomurabacteria bacterium]|nr:hypothetical protein [Candidatus Nomurabacteria bacterium]
MEANHNTSTAANTGAKITNSRFPEGYIVKDFHIQSMNPKEFWEFLKLTHPIMDEFLEEPINGHADFMLFKYDKANMHCNVLYHNETPIGHSMYYIEKTQWGTIMYRWNTNLLFDYQGLGLYKPLIEHSLEPLRSKIDFLVFKTQNPRVLSGLSKIAGGQAYPDYSKPDMKISEEIRDMASYYAGGKKLSNHLVLRHPVYAQLNPSKDFHSTSNVELKNFMESAMGARVDVLHSNCFQVICEIKK